MAILNSLILISSLVIIISHVFSVPLPQRLVRPKHASAREVLLRHTAETVRSLTQRRYNFSAFGKNLELVLNGKRLNVANLTLTFSEAIRLSRLLHDQTFEDRMYVWSRTALLNALSEQKVGRYETTFPVEELDVLEGDMIFDRDGIDEFTDGMSFDQLHSPRIVRDTSQSGQRLTDEPSLARRKRVKRKLTAKTTKYWSGPIPWMVNDTRFSHQEVEVIRSAIRHWEEHTCIRFKDITDPSLASQIAKNPAEDEDDWRFTREEIVRMMRLRSRVNLGRNTTSRSKRSTGIQGNMPHLIFKKENGCFSYTGRTGHNGQEISIAARCAVLGIVAHEIGHAIGFYHEHNRPDRDLYITIDRTQIKNRHTANFAITEWKDVLTNGIPYDFSSLMHYRGKEWSIGDKAVITTKDPDMQKVIGQRKGLSFLDGKLANYKFCSVSCRGQSSLDWSECARGGYRDPNSCDSCVCPEGWSPPRCLAVEKGRNVNCGETVLTATVSEQILHSPSFDNSQMNVDVFCAWHIKAPRGRRILLTLGEQFDIGYRQFFCEEYVEVRYKGVERTGPRLCSSNATTHEFLSYGEEVMLLFHSKPLGFQDKNTRWFHVTYSVADGCGGCSSDQVSPSLPACRKVEIYNCSTVISRGCGEGLTCTEPRENSCFRDVFHCCPPYKLRNGVCKLSEYGLFKTPRVSKPRWGPWSVWSKCSATCGGCGFKTRRRKCLDRYCRGKYEERERCGMDFCPVNTPPADPCIKSSSSPCPGNTQQRRCCPGLEENSTKGKCEIPSPRQQGTWSSRPT